jgi:ATP synthase protein I
MEQPQVIDWSREANRLSLQLGGPQLAVALVVGLVIGWTLDRWLGTKPWLLMLFVVLGVAAGVMNVVRVFMPRRGPRH